MRKATKENHWATSIRWSSRFPGVAAAPMLHVLGGSSSFWDDVLFIGGVVVILGILAFLGDRGGRQNKSGRQ